MKRDQQTIIIQFAGERFCKTCCDSYFNLTPIAWCLMNEWLTNFAYKINISWSAICNCRRSCYINLIDNNALSINKSSNCKPG